MEKTPSYEDNEDPRNPPSDAKQRELDRAAGKIEGPGGDEKDVAGSDEDDDPAS